ncbi:MAG: hypothetical protein PUF69_07185 [Eubacteriales bacterium]|nr:hypothetical protein [Eubacteriales bacterium]
MNKLKYEILTYVDSSNEDLTGFDIVSYFQSLENDILIVEKHFSDLSSLGYVDSCAHENYCHVTVYGREYIDSYEFQQEHHRLYVEQLNDAKQVAKYSKVISIISSAIAALAVAANILIAILN